MDATFMRRADGGWINAAHVREINEQGVAIIPLGNSVMELKYPLCEDWSNPDNLITLTEYPPHD